MKTIQLITLTATLALAACGKDNIPDTPADNGELKIIATIAASPDADVLPAGRSADTRATMTPTTAAARSPRATCSGFR